MNNILQVTGLTKNHAHLRALKGIDLSVRAGEIVGLVGENGAGKSTLISLLSGVAQPDRGAMTLCGDSFAPRNEQEARSAGVSAVHQRFVMDGSLTVAEAIAGLGRGAEGDREELLERAREVLRDSPARTWIRTPTSRRSCARRKHSWRYCAFAGRTPTWY